MKFGNIPTRYADVEFRSRLEARWACFFDLVEWEWEYESYDMPWWIPDFLIHGFDHPILVEVKPIIWGRDMQTQAINDPELKKTRGHNDYEVLILGSGLGFYKTEPCLGLIVGQGYHEDKRAPGYDDPAMLEITTRNFLDFRGYWGNFAHRISGLSDGKHHINPAPAGRFNSCWVEAGNRVQWKKPK